VRQKRMFSNNYYVENKHLFMFNKSKKSVKAL